MIEFKIHLQMAKKRLTQKEVANLAGIHPAIMSKYYHGTITRINPDQLNAFCKIFDCKIEDLIEYVPDKEDN